MKRILIFSLAYHPHVGGAEVAIKEITDRISPEEIEFHLICNRYDSTLPKVERLGNVTVHRIGITISRPTAGDMRGFPLHLNKLLYQFLAVWRAYRLHRAQHFDGIWAMMAHTAGVPAALFKMLYPRVGYVLTLQEGDPPEQIEQTMRPFGPLFRRAFTRADVVQVISTFLADWARRMGTLAPIEIIPNGVDAARFSVPLTAAERYAARAALGAGEHDTLLVTTSRLVQKNGIDTVLRALAQLPPETHFVIFGVGPEEAGLRTLAAALRLGDRVRFAGQADHATLPRHLAAADIFIRPSRSEGMGISFIEAMAAGVPVVATQVGGIADFLYDATRNPNEESTGWAVDPNHPGQIAAAVQDIMANPEVARKTVVRARAMVHIRYDWDGIARAMHDRVFTRLL